MSSGIPGSWLTDPPETLVTGDGAYADALAFVLGTAALKRETVAAGPQPNAVGSFPRVLDELRRVLLVVSESMSAAEALQLHEALWRWVGKLASAGEQHDLAFIFILPADAPPSFDAALAVGLALSKINPATTGHAVWRRSGGLQELLDVIGHTRPMDLVALRSRRAADSRHTALAELQAAASSNDASAASAAVRNVRAAFSGREYDLDLFCRPPSHQHGNLLRKWLDAAVTSRVTPDWWATGREQLAGWLTAQYDRKTK